MRSRCDKAENQVLQLLPVDASGKVSYQEGNDVQAREAAENVGRGGGEKRL
jgi:hypothetical protein